MLTTDLTISGKAAQFGRGVLADVSGKLIGQFAQRLEADLLARRGTPRPPRRRVRPSRASAPAARRRRGCDLNLLSVVAVPLAKRAAPVAGGLLAGLVLGWLFGRRGGGKPRYILVERVQDALVGS